ncbi:MAG TPA: nitroreductase [Bacteroidetes bacterium]|nr:nitroreductase [Bacteroidota bacterium]
MMDFLELVRKRQSDRKYLDRPVEKDILNRCIEAARLAPSACNAQPWKFIVVDNPELKNRLADATSSRVLPLNHFTKQAPVHVVIVREPANITSRLGTAIKDREFPLIDIGIAAAHFCLQATSEGLGTCILGWFNEKKVRELLKIPQGKRPELIITLGYPSGPSRKKRRKPHEKIVSFNQYTES